jgi:hypothetical protein
MTTFALRQQVFDLDGKTKRRRSVWITVASGLSWQEAKARRNANRRARLNIVPERPV